MSDETIVRPCPECEFPMVSARSGSVNGGYISFGCSRCSHRKLEALRKELRDLHSGEALPRWAGENLPSLADVQARNALRRSATQENK